MGIIDEKERFTKAWAGFYYMRRDIGKPMENARDRKQIYKRLIEFSGGDYGIMADMLEKATEKRWANVFPLNGGTAQSQTEKAQRLIQNMAYMLSI
jgi:hypothetical protein